MLKSIKQRFLRLLGKAEVEVTGTSPKHDKPSHFCMFFFDDATDLEKGYVRLSENSDKAQLQISQVVKFVCLSEGLFNAVELLAVQHPFSAGVGRKVDGGGLALETSNGKLINELKDLPNVIYKQVAKDAKPYIEAWEKVRLNPDEFRKTKPDEDKAIYADMAPEGRYDMIEALIRNAYKTQFKLLKGRYPLVDLFQVFLDAAVRGPASLVKSA